MCVPDKVMANKEFESFLDTTDEWIRQRTGIYERRIADKKTAASDLGAAAAKSALVMAGASARDVELLICPTATPDMIFPSTACIIQDHLGIRDAALMDLGAACAGSVYGFSVATQFLRAGTYKNALVVATEVFSRILDWKDRGTSILFGDGASAFYLERVVEEENDVLATTLSSDGRYWKLLYVPAGGSARPASKKTVAENLHTIRMDGTRVFKQAVRCMQSAAEVLLEKTGLRADEIDLFVPHQANNRILDAVAKGLGVPADRFFSNVRNYGNTSAASVGIAVTEAFKEGRIKKGSRVMLLAFGAGFVWGGAVLRWSIDPEVAARWWRK
jgi:3-oxoacyl-[acyl-carrier-protein] synthase-3